MTDPTVPAPGSDEPATGTALVVDDSAVNRKLLARLLERLGVRVLEVDDGSDALTLLQGPDGPSVDLVLLDVVMPGMDGYQTLAAVKGDERLRRLPVIMVSGNDELDSVVRCIELGATDYLTKPISPAILSARIRASLADKRIRDLELEYIERQSVTNEVLKVISTSVFDLELVLQTVVDAAARLCHSEHGAIYIIQDDAFVIAASHGYEGFVEYEREFPLRPGRGSVVGRTAQTGSAVHIPDVLVDPEYELQEIQERYGFRTLVGVPIQREGRIIGVVAAARDQVRPFNEPEILLLTAFADQAAIAIENARLVQTIELQKTELSRFLSPQVAALISSAEGEQMLAGHRRQATAVFCDLRGFTAFSETAEPEELLGVLRDYHREMGELIVEHGGTLEHFAGDGMMVFFNDPVLQEDHVVRAVRMAMAMRDRFAAVAGGWRKRGYDLGFGVGIATGYATLGRIGFEGRYDYGMVGTAVILAQRLSAEAEPGQILLSQRAHAIVEDDVEVESVGELTLKGFSRPVPAFNVVAIRAATATTAG